MNKAIFCCFKEKKSINARMRPMFQQVAKEFEIENFQASAGWLEKFKL